MITPELREKIRIAILEDRAIQTSLSDSKYAKSIGLNPAIFSRLKNGETENIASVSFWLTMGRKLNVSTKNETWEFAETYVYKRLKQQIEFSKYESNATILVDECGIGKTYCTKHIIRKLPNAFYFDCSQAKTKSQFIRSLAQTLGVDNTGRLFDVKENLKYLINEMDRPFIALDDTGYLDANVLIEIIELWNATEDRCGWLMIGDDSLQNKINRGLKSKKIGYKALFSRFSNEFLYYTPVPVVDKKSFYKELLTNVASVNLKDKKLINQLLGRALTKEHTLRYLKTAIEYNKQKEKANV